MLEAFYPDVWLSSAYAVDYGQLYRNGIRGLIFDIDNTLVPHGAHADDRAKELFRFLNDTGFKIMLLSNNKEPRVRSFKEEVIYCGYIYKAGKPARNGYIRAMEEMGTNRGNTVFIGDQLFTDVFGAKRSGIKAVLVKPIDKREEIQIVLKRRLEAVVLFFYRRRQLRELHK
ncbi:MAG TPA: YqeG family HAD IIIA-type phosphatase [Lachnospiraceae bacterium]|nr:YqeG family HAD IIIA-type phosphatase [Lachnospiraceae bacterium]